jgi:hypothetical protein
LDKDDAGAGILVDVQAPDPPFSISMGPARAQSAIGVGPLWAFTGTLSMIM